MPTLMPFDDVGQGPAVLLLHAGVADRRMWRHQLPALAVAGYRALAPDLRGFGDAPAASEPFSLAADLTAVLDAAGVERVTVVGISMGGDVALDFALTTPERVERLVLVSTLAGLSEADEPSPELQKAWTGADAAFERGDLARATEIDLLTWLVGPGRSAADLDADYLELGRRMVARTWERAADGQNRAEPIEPEVPGVERLAEIRVPTLLIKGNHDVPDVALSMDRLAAGIPHAQRASIVDSAHLPPLERPVEFNDILIGFLQTSLTSAR